MINNPSEILWNTSVIKDLINYFMLSISTLEYLTFVGLPMTTLSRALVMAVQLFGFQDPDDLMWGQFNSVILLQSLYYSSCWISTFGFTVTRKKGNRCSCRHLSRTSTFFLRAFYVCIYCIGLDLFFFPDWAFFFFLFLSRNFSCRR